MGAAELLGDVVVLLAASLPVVFVFQRLRVPALVGFLVAGVLVGPSTTGLISRTETADFLAELGVVLLLFTVGLQVSLTELTRLRRLVLTSASLQVGGTLAATAALAGLLGVAVREAVVIGFLVALSSTVIVLKTLADRGELESPQGRLALGILLFQDLCVLPMMMLLPSLSTSGELSLLRVLLVLGQAALVVGVLFYVARIVFPAIMRRVLALRIRELFVGVVILFCLGTAWLTAQFGVSLAVGAFIAGLVISESEYSHQVVAEVLPLSDLLSSVFFVSIGMLLDMRLVWSQGLLVLGLVAGVMVLKAVMAIVAVYVVSRSARIALVVALTLAEIGEFSFVLAREAVHVGALQPATFQTVLAVAVITMLASPFLIAAVPAIGLRLFGETGGAGEDEVAASPGGHVVIIGYGLNGQNLARVLRETGIAHRILDLNADAVRIAAAAGRPILFGDATRPSILKRVDVGTAATVVVAISDPLATRRVVSLVRHINRQATLIVRTRFVSEIEDLYRLGADEVIPEEFETSVEIFARVLQRMHVPRNVIDMQIDLVRGERYAMLRGLQGRGLEDLHAVLEASTTETFLLLAGSPAIGERLRDLDLRAKTGVTVIAVVRAGRPQANPSPEFRLRHNDVLVMIGSHVELAAAARLLGPTAEKDHRKSGGGGQPAS